MAKITKARQAEMMEARERLRTELSTVDTIYTVLTHVSSSGMFRAIRPIVINADREPWDLTWLVARAGIGKASQRHGGIEMGGCGMDMGFSLVYDIGRTVIPRDQPWACRGDRCQSNDHSNRVNRRGSDVVHAADGGYRFRHQWL